MHHFILFCFILLYFSFLVISLVLSLGERNDRFAFSSVDDQNGDATTSEERYSEDEKLISKFHKALVNQYKEEISLLISDDIVFSLQGS